MRTPDKVLCRVCTQPATGPLCLDCEAMLALSTKRITR